MVTPLQKEMIIHKTTKIFFGWVVVLCAFLVLFVAYGVQYSYGVFFPALSKEFGWSRTTVATAFSVYAFVYSLFSLPSGKITDLWGPKRVVALGGLLLGSGLMLLSNIKGIWQLYLFYGLIAALGMSTAYIPCNSTVVKWFIKKRGLALGITTSGGSFGAFVIPPLASYLISTFNWRMSFFILGAAMLILLNIIALFMIRDPEQIGQKPDGLSASEEPEWSSIDNSRSDDGPVYSLDMDRNLSQTLRTRVFWILCAMFIATWMTVFLPLVHIVSFAIDLGISKMLAATAVSVLGLSAALGRMMMGAVSDRIGRKKALGFCFILQILSFIGFAMTEGIWLLYFSAMIFGCSYGSISTLFPAIIGDFFGRTHVGAICGFVFAAAGSSAAFGPAIAGYIFDSTGQYTWAFLLSALLNAVAFVILFFAQKPKPLVLPELKKEEIYGV